MDIYEDPEAHHDIFRFGDSCGENAPENIDLPCYICKELGDCYFHLFMVGEDKEETAEEVIQCLGDTQTNAIEMYLGHLGELKKTYRGGNNRIKNLWGEPWIDIIVRKISLLEEVILKRENAGFDCVQLSLNL